MRKYMFLFATLSVALFSVSCDDDWAPKSARDSFKSQYPNAIDVEWDTKHGYSVAEFHIAGEWGECEAWYTKGGRWVMTEYDIRFEELPMAVQTAFKEGYGEQTPVSDVERLERNNASTIYFIETQYVYNGFLTDICLDYAEDGTLLRTSAYSDDYAYYYIPF